MASPREHGEDVTYDRRAALEAAIRAAEAGTAALESRFRRTDRSSLAIWTKGPGALVTDADIASDQAIASVLSAAEVPARLLSEERPPRSGDPDQSGPSDLTWLVDPLCGTTPFSTGMGHWGINIALRSERGIEVAAMAIPAMGELLTAVKGRGAARNGRRLDVLEPSGRLANVAIGLEIDSGKEWARRARSDLDWTADVGQINSFASAAYPIAQVILGRLHAVVIYTVAPVHIAAGAGLGLELGLKVTDREGKPLDWAEDGDRPCAIFGWPSVHEELIRALRR